VIPPPVTVIRPSLVLGPGLAVLITILNVPLLLPLVGVTFSQDVALLDALHDLLDVTFTVCVAVVDEVSHVFVFSVKVGAGGACVTFIVRVIPPPVTVIRPVLAAVPVLLLAIILNEPLLLPLAGVTLSQEVALLDTVHDLLDVTFTVRSPAFDAMSTEVVFTVNAAAAGAPACVTVISRVIPPPITLTVAVLDDVLVLVVAFIENEPLPVRLVGDMLEIVSQAVLLLVIFHDVLELILTVALPDAEPGDQVLLDTVSVLDKGEIGK